MLVFFLSQIPQFISGTGKCDGFGKVSFLASLNLIYTAQRPVITKSPISSFCFRTERCHSRQAVAYQARWTWLTR